MKTKQAAPIIATFAPAAFFAPPILVGAFVGLGLIWLLSGGGKSKKESPPKQKSNCHPANSQQPSKAVSGQIQHIAPPANKITRYDLAEALAYGVRQFTRKEAVAALESLGFGKTAAYKALSPAGKFSSLIGFTQDGLIEWKG